MHAFVNILGVDTRGDTKLMPPIPPPETITAIIMHSTYIMGSSFTKFRFFHVVFIINTLFPPLRETQYAGRVELFAVSARRRRQNGGLGVHASGGQKHGSRVVLNQERREEHDAEQSCTLLQLPPLWANWCAVYRLCSTNILRGPHPPTYVTTAVQRR
jgi:hypothetical protein